jgi:hypothetical protein
MKPVILSEGELEECLGPDITKRKRRRRKYVYKQRIHPIAYLLAASIIAYALYILIAGYSGRGDVLGERIMYLNEGFLEEGPEVTPCGVETINYSHADYVGRLKKVGCYSATVMVLDKQFHSLVKSDAPADLLIVWGDFARPEYEKYIKYSQFFTGGGFHVSGDAPSSLRSPLENRNNYAHIRAYPANKEVMDGLRSIRGKQVVHIEGYLVDVSLEGRGLLETSTILTDHGVGSCELVYVDNVTVGGRTYM